MSPERLRANFGGMRRRLATTLVLGAGVPMGVLAWLAIGSIERQRGQELRDADERAARGANAVAERVEGLLQHEEETLLHQVRDGLTRALQGEPSDDELEPGASQPVLSARGRTLATALEALASEELTREAFLVSRSGHLVWPRLARHSPPPPHKEEPADRELVVSALSEAERAPDLAWAETLLQPALSLCKDESLLCVLRLKQAELLVRRGVPERALPVLSLVRSNDGARDLGGEPTAPDALRRIAEVGQKVGRPELALEALVALAQGLADDRWGQEPSLRRALLDAAVADARLLVADMGGRDVSRELRAIDRAQARGAFLESFEDRIVPELRLRLHPAPSEDQPSGPMRLGLDVLGEPRLFVAASIGPAIAHETAPLVSAVSATATRPALREPPALAVVGLEVELSRLRDRLVVEIAQVQSTTGSRIAVVDETGTHFAGDEDLAALPTRGPGRPLSDSLPGWRVVAVPRDPGASERLARTSLVVSGLLVASCALAALVSFVVALRATSRELEVVRVRGDLVRNVSHELRTPVASVLMLAEVLEEGGLPPEKQSDYVTRIAREARRLSRLIENVLDLAKVERGARKVELLPVALGETVLQAVEGFRASEEGREASVVLTDPAPETVVTHDPAALELVLQNLVSNAVKYSPRGESVEVVVAYLPAEARVSVKDKGRGLGPDEQRRLFAPFYRARPEDGEATGVGLGLVITRELVRLHGGRLELVSELGKGSTFTLVLPLH